MDDRRGVSSISTVCFLIAEYFSHVFVVVVLFAFVNLTQFRKKNLTEKTLPSDLHLGESVGHFLD